MATKNIIWKKKKTSEESNGWKKQKTNDGTLIYSKVNEMTRDQPKAGLPLQTIMTPQGASEETRIPLGDGKFLTVNVFRNQIKIHIREFFQHKNGFMVPTKRGITINPDQWKALGEHVPVVDEAVRNLTKENKEEIVLKKSENGVDVVDHTGQSDYEPKHPMINADSYSRPIQTAKERRRAQQDKPCKCDNTHLIRNGEGALCYRCASGCFCMEDKRICNWCHFRSIQ